MNGIVFCDMPAFVNTSRSQQLQQLMQRGSSGSSEQYHRLFAMGVDAYQLTHQLRNMQSGAQYEGVTGNLSLNNNYINRRLAWAKMSDGAPTPVN